MSVEQIRPRPAPYYREGTARYDWTKITMGEWQCWVDTHPDVPNRDAIKLAERVRFAARSYAARHGLVVESRRTNKGHTLDLRFTKAGS